MQCLYCKKKLGLFASKKRPFCSEQHEVAFNDEQAGLAMRRVLDPLFLSPQPKTPLQAPAKPVTPPPAPLPVGAEAAEPELPPPPTPVARRPVAPQAPPAVAPQGPPPVARREPDTRPAPAAQAKPSFEPIQQPPTHEKFVSQWRLVPYPPGPDEQLAAFPAALPQGEVKVSASGLDPIEAPEKDAASIEAPKKDASSIEALEKDASSIEASGEPEQAAEIVATQPVATPEPTEQPQPIEPGGPLATALHPAIPQEKPEFPVEEGHTPAMVEAQTTPLAFDAQAPQPVPSGLQIETAPAPPPVTPAPEPERIPSLAPRLPDPLAPAPHQRATAEVSPLDPPEMALRFPFANLIPVRTETRAPDVEIGPAAPVYIRWTPSGGTRTAPEPELRRAGPEVRTPESSLPEQGDPKLPASPLALLERSQAANGEPVRWKVLPGLRESPSKLRHPQAASGMALRLGDSGTQRNHWQLAASAADFALPVCDAQTREFQPVIPDRIETVARLLNLSSSGTQGQDWRAAFIPVSLALPLGEAQLPVLPAATPAWRQPEIVTGLGIAGLGLLPWLRREPAPENLKTEGVRQTQQVRPPRPVEAEGLSIMSASLMELARSIQPDRRLRYRPSELVGDTAGIQRVRPASLIQVREPQLDQSNPSDLPSAQPWLDWKSIRPAEDQHIPGSAVPLRPTLRNPEWSGGADRTR